ncbi:granzyme E-like [Cyclopterus lumpus]|uniref:trypsin n=1 Tax=Cyclopterus lumpus TaxID=8103 RepID=A0A8C2WAD8_CYCLU|nr:granzyme E-like [Cyclopterus lumpus]
MFLHPELLALLLVLTLGGRVRAAKIIGGREAEPHSRPYMALVELREEDGQKKHCGGFLLQEDFVMTAAHCQARFYTVYLGLHRVPKGAEIQRLSVKQSYPHEDFTFTDFKNDIMLLKLSSKANFTQNVRPIALADKSDVSLPNSCLVSGWGATHENTKHMSRVLMEVNVTLADRQRCAEDHLYCSEEKTGPSKGDSGGPLVCEGKAYGVASVSFQPKSNLYYFTKIPDYRSWIDPIVHDL